MTDCGAVITLLILYYVHFALPSCFLNLETVVFSETPLQQDWVPQSPFSGAGNSKLRLMGQSHLRVEQYGFASIICALMQQLQSCDWTRRTVSFVRLVLKVFMQNNGDFIDKTMLYLSTRENGISSQKTAILLHFLCFRWCIGRWLPKQIFWIPRLWAEIWRMHIEVSSENKIWAAFTKWDAYCVRNTADY